MYTLILYFHTSGSVTLLKFISLSKGRGSKNVKVSNKSHRYLTERLKRWTLPMSRNNSTWAQYLLTFGVYRKEISVFFFLIITCRIIWAFEKVIVCGRGHNIRDWLLLWHDLTSFTGPQSLWVVEMSWNAHVSIARVQVAARGWTEEAWHNKANLYMLMQRSGSRY